ncbi:hypothetical protein [Roseixanthobacter pseudopolyaromaticivorans]|uniref:hypothetical protein n=1 Tax=Xanthobacteraceae TaxID=335928 RepID=UPI00372A11E6
MPFHRALLSAATCTLAIVVSFSSPARAGKDGTYCRTAETIVFSCDLGSHTLSLCASKDIGDGRGFLQYRFGHLDRVLTSYPAPGTKPADAFTVGTLMFAGGGGAWLRFQDQAIRYTLFNAIGKWNPKGGTAEVSGVVVEQNGQPSVTMVCRDHIVGGFGSGFFEKAGLKAEGEFEIPEDAFPK